MKDEWKYQVGHDKPALPYPFHLLRGCLGSGQEFEEQHPALNRLITTRNKPATPGNIS